MGLQSFIENIRKIQECLWDGNYTYNAESSPNVHYPKIPVRTVLRISGDGIFTVAFVDNKNTDYSIFTTFSKLVLFASHKTFEHRKIIEIDPRTIETEEEFFQRSLVQDLSLLTFEDCKLLMDVHCMLFDIFEYSLGK